MAAEIPSSGIRARPVPDVFAPGLRMSLPPNYRQVAMMGTTPAPGPTRRPADRLARTPSTPSSSSKGVGEANVPSPFTTPHHGNPAFNPQKMGTGKGVSKHSGEGRIPKPPKAPDKPLMPYMRYSRKVWDQVKAANNDLKLWEIGKIIGSMWRDLPEADKQDYVDEYESEKLEYEKALKSYHASPSYQAYLNAKTKGTLVPTGTIATEEKEILDRSSSTATVGSKLDRRIDIQPAEDEDDYDDGLSVKHVSHSRYIRNHRLINEIFSDTMVPDVRSVVTSQRLTVLRRQVQSLTMHQKKLETELQQIEEKFEAKKRKFIEAGDSFQSELKKVKATAPKLDETSFASMVERQKEVLRREAEERQRSAQGLPSRPPSTSSSQVQPQSNAASREDSNDAAGPAPQNTATPVDAAASPAPMQENDLGGEDENKMEASTAVTSTAAAAAPNVAAPTTTTAAAVPAVNGPTSAAPSAAPPLAPSAAAGGSSSQMTSAQPASAQNTAAHSDASSAPRPAPPGVSSNPAPLPGPPQAPPASGAAPPSTPLPTPAQAPAPAPAPAQGPPPQQAPGPGPTPGHGAAPGPLQAPAQAPPAQGQAPPPNPGPAPAPNPAQGPPVAPPPSGPAPTLTNMATPHHPQMPQSNAIPGNMIPHSSPMPPVTMPGGPMVPPHPAQMHPSNAIHGNMIPSHPNQLPPASSLPGGMPQPHPSQMHPAGALPPGSMAPSHPGQMPPAGAMPGNMAPHPGPGHPSGPPTSAPPS
ncbi:SWI/SNF-related matrix-associated actin-dependent regulator of chromatin subfamily E member 1-like isoform X17 [Penaeus japonicus]|uniref:SWI/SNF-related matrix-associated actin-dependent regulator of chromatin subfamily E member 1-like isoform X17 n=2 Tax=Penaeus japonicus TaxID=27405 RepID=UPI001C712234|nr:SWI/SNF-related matrix-associated actin-dependent regulator of chromatin subfamily E member 1-like isoform X17 [Penaeus japonicus]